MKKKKTWIVFVYSVVIIVALSLFLIFFPKPNETPNNPGSTPPASSGGGSQSQTYASKLILNCARQLTISVGNEVELLDGFITVEPAAMKNKINVGITPKNNASTTGLEFKDNVITAKSVGSYSVRFSVQKSATSTYADTLTVSVVERLQDNRIEQVATNSTLEKVVTVEELFVVNSTYDNLIIENNEYVSFAENKLTSSKIGNTNLNISLIDDYFSYSYVFDFEIKPKPLYSIVVDECLTNYYEVSCEVGDFVELNYSVYDLNYEYVSQVVTVVISDESVVSLDGIMPPTIYLLCKSKGSFTLTIKSELENAEDRVINITIK